MISFDKILYEFVTNNWMTLMFLYMILQGLARETKWTWDEKLVNILAEAFSFLRGKTYKNGAKK